MGHFARIRISSSLSPRLPSGNISLVQHVRSNTSFTSPDCNSQDQFASRNHLLIKAGTDGEFHFAVRIHAIVDCPDRMSDCVTTLHFHRFLDKIQFDRQETVCTDPRYPILPSTKWAIERREFGGRAVVNGRMQHPTAPGGEAATRPQHLARSKLRRWRASR